MAKLPPVPLHLIMTPRAWAEGWCQAAADRGENHFLKASEWLKVNHRSYLSQKLSGMPGGKKALGSRSHRFASRIANFLWSWASHVTSAILSFSSCKMVPKIPALPKSQHSWASDEITQFWSVNVTVIWSFSWHFGYEFRRNLKTKKVYINGVCLPCSFCILASLFSHWAKCPCRESSKYSLEYYARVIELFRSWQNSLVSWTLFIGINWIKAFQAESNKHLMKV